jgi:hypothetical protein
MSFVYWPDHYHRCGICGGIWSHADAECEVVGGVQGPEADCPDHREPQGRIGHFISVGGEQRFAQVTGQTTMRVGPEPGWNPRWNVPMRRG